jgi:hypothetical protein
MAAAANDPEIAKRTGVPQRVGRDFLNADKGRAFGKRSGRKAKRKSGRK